MLQITDLTFDAYGRRFFQGASALVPTGAKVGVVGRNGVGKSTLFKLLTGEFTPGGGEIVMPRRARLGSVAQEHAATPTPLLDTILEADVERAELMARLDTAPPEEIGEIWERLIAIDAESAPARAAEILAGLGFTEADLGRAMSEFSGGWRMRVALAAALFAEPDVLLLDEPTNYLDLEGALWLEARLKKYPHTCLIISHDRELLNNSVDSILHVADGKLDYYAGGYDAFEDRRAEKLRQQAAQKAKVDAERAHLQSFVDRFRAKASKAVQAQSRLKRLAKLKPVEVTIEDRVAPFVLPSPTKTLAPPILRLEKASVGYDGPPVLRNLHLRLDPDDRIGLLGVNGAGKSTFAKFVAGALQNSHGEVWRDGRMKVGWFHQHQIEALDPEDTPLAIMRRATPEATESSRRARLAHFGLGFDKQETTVENLSGGERARLLLNMVAMTSPHVLILDEPTNHLDIDSRRALLDALNDYAGAVILITHDRSLMELVADRLWLAADGTIKPFDGDMDDYAKFVLDRARKVKPAQNREPEPAPAPPPPTPPAPPARREAAEPLKRKLDAAEQALARATERLERLDAELADTDLYVRNPARARDLTESRPALQDKVDTAEAEWLALAERYEAAAAA